MLGEDDQVLEKFVSDTGTKAMVGYTKDVGWVPSAAMDMLFFDVIADYSRWAAARNALEASSAVRALRGDAERRASPSQRTRRRAPRASVPCRRRARTRL